MARQDDVTAYVDGELSREAAAAFDQELQRDPVLAAEVDRQRRLRARLAAAYAPVLDEPLPPGLLAIASAANDRAGWRRTAPYWAGMAACLAAGVLVGRTAFVPAGPVAAEGGRLVARGELAATLDQALAADGGPLRVGVTFRTAQGDYCRTFQSAPDRLAGLACREGGVWAAKTLAEWRTSPAPAYRTAGVDTPPQVQAAVDQLIAGDAFDAAQERAARDGGWRTGGK